MNFCSYEKVVLKWNWSCCFVIRKHCDQTGSTTLIVANSVVIIVNCTVHQ